jgi:uncharacterized membrane protein YphA (DoxX/SURF4 family)
MNGKPLLRQLPIRIAAGAFVLQSGLGKLAADQADAERLHGFAAGTYPFLGKLEPKRFTRLLAMGEIVSGAALLIPVVPTALAGLGLGAFAAGLLGLYLKTPGMRREGTLRPTEEGVGLAKDVWLLGIALSLVLDELTERGERR